MKMAMMEVGIVVIDLNSKIWASTGRTDNG
jgi:hypothetical protein